MEHAELTDLVRQRIRDYFTQLGWATDKAIRETILIRDGFYCGRRFHADEQQAIWFIEEMQLKFFRADGSLAQTIDIRDSWESRQNRAA